MGQESKRKLCRKLEGKNFIYDKVDKGTESWKNLMFKNCEKYSKGCSEFVDDGKDEDEQMKLEFQS